MAYHSDIFVYQCMALYTPLVLCLIHQLLRIKLHSFSPKITYTHSLDGLVTFPIIFAQVKQQGIVILREIGKNQVSWTVREMEFVEIAAMVRLQIYNCFTCVYIIMERML